jgi:hypothetical protein
MGALSFLPGSVPLGSQIAGAQATTNLTLIANPNTAAFGTPVTFNATLGGGNSPTGSISMGAYTDPSCNDFSFSLGVDNNVNAGNGTYALGTVTPAVGTYYGSAFYASGDTSINDNSSSGYCDLLLTVNSAVATTALTLSASPNPAAFGTPVTFSATLSGGNSPTGSISLGAYTDPSCNDLAFTLGVDNNVNAGNGTYTIGTTTPVAAGTYYGSAFYAGDGSNSSSSSGSCQPILVVSSRQHHVHSCTLIVNLGPYFLELILTDGPDSPIALFFDNIAPCITP